MKNAEKRPCFGDYGTGSTQVEVFVPGGGLWHDFQPRPTPVDVNSDVFTNETGYDITGNGEGNRESFHEWVELINDATLKELIDDQISDYPPWWSHKRCLLRWAYLNSRWASDAALQVNQAAPNYYQMPAYQAAKTHLHDTAGASCDASGYLLRKVMEAYGYDAATLGMGIAGAYQHTGVVVHDDNDMLSWYDPTFDVHHPDFLGFVNAVKTQDDIRMDAIEDTWSNHPDKPRKYIRLAPAGQWEVRPGVNMEWLQWTYSENWEHYKNQMIPLFQLENLPLRFASLFMFPFQSNNPALVTQLQGITGYTGNGNEPQSQWGTLL